MKLRNFLLIPILIVNILGCKPKYDETVPKMTPVTEAVFASGSIDPKDAYILTSLSDGFIEKCYVSENDLVKDKQLLFVLDNRQQHTQVSIARNNLDYARISASNASPALSQIKVQIEAAKIKMVSDSVTLGRYEQLYRTNSVSKQDLDNVRVAYQTSSSSYYALLESYKITSDRVKQDLANSDLQLRNAEEGNQYYNLYAIGKGKVYQVFKKQGDLVRRGEQVAQLGSPDSIVINLEVDEGTISKIKLGQQVLVELNTEKNKTYQAYISKIYPHFSETTQSYKVEARFKEHTEGLLAGTQLQANIITAKKESAMMIPHSYLITENKVLVRRGDKLDTLVVATGVVSDDWIEIVSGLTVNDKIVKLK